MLQDERFAIASSLTQVADVHGFPYKPSAPNTGDAWPLLGSLDRADGLAFYVNWRVVVLLPQDEQKASEWIDSHYEPLVDVLHDVGFVSQLQPVRLADTNQLALEILMRS